MRRGREPDAGQHLEARGRRTCPARRAPGSGGRRRSWPAGTRRRGWARRRAGPRCSCGKNHGDSTSTSSDSSEHSAVIRPSTRRPSSSSSSVSASSMHHRRHVVEHLPHEAPGLAGLRREGGRVGRHGAQSAPTSVESCPPRSQPAGRGCAGGGVANRAMPSRRTMTSPATPAASAPMISSDEAA